jgi:hypothetical protein
VFEPTEATRVAIECLRIWLETDKEKAAEHLAHLQHSPDGPGARTMISGFLNLSELLVLSLAKERGANAGNLKEKAGDIAVTMCDQNSDWLRAGLHGGSIR